MAPNRLPWSSQRATLPSSQSVRPLTMKTTIAQPSSCGPRRSHRNSGTPRSRRTLRAFGTVQILSVLIVLAPLGRTWSLEAGHFHLAPRDQPLRLGSLAAWVGARLVVVRGVNDRRDQVEAAIYRAEC
jgi:hypothetical protein